MDKLQAASQRKPWQNGYHSWHCRRWDSVRAIGDDGTNRAFVNAGPNRTQMVVFARLGCTLAVVWSLLKQ